MSHDYILNAIGPAPGRELIKQWLKAGYVEAEMFYPTPEGTPQGGVISPLLANIALDGMESLLNQFSRTVEYTLYRGTENSKTRRNKQKRYGFIRYADDFIVTARSREDINAIVPTLVEWLKQRGLELNQDKTQIVSIQDGFDFLGVTIRQFKGHCLPIPQKAKVLAFIQRIRDWLKQHLAVSPEVLIRHLNPILLGWGNYYRHWVSKQVFGYVDHEIWKAIWSWCLRRHPNKGKGWVKRKYFPYIGTRQWNFSVLTMTRARQPKRLTLYKLMDIPIQRHVKVKGTASPDDPGLMDYWRYRQTRYGKTYWGKGSKLRRVSENQQWRCPVCHDHLFNGEEIHLHHVMAVKDGGTDYEENLRLLHQACHRHVHLQKVESLKIGAG